MRHAIHELKYRNLRAIAPTLAGYLNEYLVGWAVDFDFLIPVPLHKRRLRERGYNQAELLARALSQKTSVPVVTNCLWRSGGETSQVHSANAEERYRNVTGAFTCTGESLSGKRIMLIDDVCTTGATLEACAAALRSVGAQDVFGLTVAREV